ncbi:MAG: DNA-processing protein DprA [Caldilineales bacterium]|nr:DNA-processing protein DprA [Caldilineales bacterium]
MENTIPYWIGFNQAPGVGAKRLRALLDYFGSIEAAWHAPAAELAEAGLDRRGLEGLLKTRESLDLEAEWQRLQQANVQVLTWESPNYPRRLLQIDSPPPVLYMRGEVWASDEWAVAIVGTRRATTYGRECALRLATDLAQAGVTIVSGLARGIDGAAHHAAMETNGRTLAVLGNGLDMIYPPEHRDLAHRIVQQGALLSEHMLGIKPDARHFPARNRIISGLSMGVIVVEGSWSSGAVITAKQALEQGREVFAIPGSILAPGSEGPNRLIRDGATPVLGADDVLEALNLRQVADKVDARKTLPEDPIEARIMELLSAEPRHVDEIRRETEMPVQEVSSALALMELKGLVRQVGGMQYVVAREPGVVYRIG